MTENILAIRRKKESSLVKAMMLARNNEVDAVLSCGNTGAYYACAMLFLKRIKGIDKSCLMATIPTLNDKGVCMLDVGANAENTVDQLVQFAIMGNVYAKNVRHIQNLLYDVIKMKASIWFLCHISTRHRNAAREKTICCICGLISLELK